MPYYLDESNNWGCNINILNTSLQLAKEQGICIRALVIINPGNPTGQILNEESMKEIINFCSINEICIMADEVYQENIWKEGIKFISFRKVVYDMMKENPDLNVQMVSFHSISKVINDNDDAVVDYDDNIVLDVDDNKIDVDDQSNWQIIILYDTKSGLFRRMWLKRWLF